MDLPQIEQHWTNWAKTYKSDVRATTKTPTIKQLEIFALKRALKRTGLTTKSEANILEVGCGNGYNCLGLANEFPGTSITGVDYIEEMVEHAKTIRDEAGLQKRVHYYQGNILELAKHPQLTKSFDVVFTDRCVINLNSPELQLEGIKQLLSKVSAGGHLILIENMQHSYDWQNQLRSSVDLPERTPDKFNLFLDEASLVKSLGNHVELIDSENFAALHDLLLYVLVPMINNGEVDYDHPIVSAATTLLSTNNDEFSRAFGAFGQNRLLIFRKK